MDKKAIEMKRMGTASLLHQSWARVAAGGSSAHSGAGLSGERLDIDVCIGESRPESGVTAAVRPESAPSTSADTRHQELTEEEASPVRYDDGLGDDGVRMVEVADVEAWDWVSVRATRGFLGDHGKHSVEMEVTPVETRRRRATSNSKSGTSEDRNTLRYSARKTLARLVLFLMRGHLCAANLVFYVH